MKATRAYLVIVGWPAGATEDSATETLVRAGMDAYTARLRARRTLPQVADRISLSERDDKLALLHGLGVLAVAPTEAELNDVCEPLMAKSLVSAGEGEYLIEPWMGQGRRLRMAEVSLMVRASVRSRWKQTSSGHDARYVAAGAALGGLQGAAIGAMIGAHSGVDGSGASVVEILDLYGPSEGPIRVSGAKHNFSVLGERRGLTDRANMETLLADLTSQAPSAVVDDCFGCFSCPTELLTVRVTTDGKSSTRKEDHMSAFDFYTRLRWIMHQHGL